MHWCYYWFELLRKQAVLQHLFARVCAFDVWLYCFVNVDLISRIHLVELINAGNTVVCQHKTEIETLFMFSTVAVRPAVYGALADVYTTRGETSATCLRNWLCRARITNDVTIDATHECSSLVSCLCYSAKQLQNNITLHLIISTN